MKKLIYVLMGVSVLLMGHVHTAYAQVAETKDFIGALKDVGDFIVENKKTLNVTKDTIRKVTKATQVLGAAGNALALIGAGMELVSAISGEKSEGEVVLEKLDNLDKSINTMWDDIGNKIADVNTKADFRQMAQQFQENADKISTKYDTWLRYQKQLLDGVIDMPVYDTTYKSGDIVDLARGLASSCVGRNAKTRIYPTVEGNSYASFSEVASWGILISQRILAAQQLATYQATIELTGGAKLETADLEPIAQSAAASISGQFEDIWADCTAAYDEAVARVTSKDTILANAKKYMDEVLLFREDLNSGNSSETLGRGLEQQFPGTAWLVGITDAITDRKKYEVLFDSTGATLRWKGRQTNPGKEINEPRFKVDVTAHFFLDDEPLPPLLEQWGVMGQTDGFLAATLLTTIPLVAVDGDLRQVFDIAGISPSKLGGFFWGLRFEGNWLHHEYYLTKHDACLDALCFKKPVVYNISLATMTSFYSP